MSNVVEVALRERAYPIHISAGCGEAVRGFAGRLAKAGRSAAVLVDAGVTACHPGLLEGFFQGLPVLALAGGEKTKSLEELARVFDFAAAQKLDRDSLLFVVGGGVIGDLGGFAAATYLRGIDFVQIPTTLLAMVDSSVGGKTGINIPAGKNLVGAFHQPKAVFIGTNFLKTLPHREFRAGMAEVLKYGLLGDEGFFRERLEEKPLDSSSVCLPEVIRRCCEIKAEIVSADETESSAEGGRALLNLGHTFAHAIEKVAGYGEYLHGEAVGLGLILAARLSQELGFLMATEVDAVRESVSRYDLPVHLKEPLPVADLLDVMQRDKKVRQGRLHFVVIERLGKAARQGGIEPDLIASLWREYGASG